MLQSFNSINDDLKGVLFQCISENKLSFLDILVVVCIYDELQSHTLRTEDPTLEDCTLALTSTVNLNLGAELCLYL